MNFQSLVIMFARNRYFELTFQIRTGRLPYVCGSNALYILNIWPQYRKATIQRLRMGLLYPAARFAFPPRQFLLSLLLLARPRGVVKDSRHCCEQKTYPLNRMCFSTFLPQFEQYLA